MASIVLRSVGTAVGAQVGGPIGAYLGARLGSALGGSIDNALTGGNSLKGTHGPRLADLAVQSSSYGKMIPIVYGRLRISGNILWSRPIKETIVTTTSSSSVGGKGGGGKVSQSSSEYNYSATLAIGVCEGPVDEVVRIWADAKLLDVSAYTIRIYRGTESQMPDPLIQSFEGVGATPAHRGLCYVVLEDFPLADFGNRIPNFTFEVRRKYLHGDYEDQKLEEMITSMVLIPGGGEFVYDTQVAYKVPGVQVGESWVQQGNQQAINAHTTASRANVLLALDQLEETCPNVDFVSVVVSWFGDSLDAGECVILPGVEYQAGGITTPESWQVAGFSRSGARLITQVGGGPQYGGTPSDAGLLRLLDELRDRGYQVALYPMVFMDVEGKPWRGEITGSAADVADFFTRTNGYNDFIEHYAQLVEGRVDAFIIGSELKGLTSVSETAGVYPAVDELVSLAASVKATLGEEVVVTYAADWSEYHHTNGGWYHMDPLWASPDIDVIGIDAYFPLTDQLQASYDLEAAINGWSSGEGYEWYYTDEARTTQASLAPAYAWKNLSWFWNNTHTNPDSSETDWVPQSKKIWFTEYGFPSVDGATNQPNVFYDLASVSSALPRFSRGRVDIRAQRTGLLATELAWQDSDMVERKFVWTWDARPYPYWPDLTSVWSDGGAWQTGHWVQGKLGNSSLAAIVADLCERAGLAEEYDVSRLGNHVEGFVVAQQQTIRSAIETLQHAYFFESVESDHVLKFVPRGGQEVASLTPEEMIADEQEPAELFSVTRAQEIELPKRVNLIYMNRLLGYQSSAQYAQREVTHSREILTVDLPIVLEDQLAKNIADITLFTSWVGRTSYGFDLPASYACLEPSDVLLVQAGGQQHRMRITATQVQSRGRVRVQAVAEDATTFDFYTRPAQASGTTQPLVSVPQTRLEILDLPALPSGLGEAALHMAASGVAAGWTGAAIYRSDDAGENYARFCDVNISAAIGNALEALPEASCCVWDETSVLTVLLSNEDAQLQTVTELAVLNGANAALLGDEVIQFRSATLIAPAQYELRGFLRGRLGTQWATTSHVSGARFVLLDGRLTRQTLSSGLVGLERRYKAVSFGTSLGEAAEQDFTYTGRALMPYSPVHLAASRDGAGNLTLRWIRRTRTGGDWQDKVDVPLGEESEAYEIDIMDDDEVVRTLSATSAEVAYSAAAQTSDFGSVPESVSVRVYQLSSVVGRGYAAVAVL